MKPWPNLLLVFLFCLGILLPTIGSLRAPAHPGSLDENRQLASLPAWRFDPGAWQEYCRQLETFYDDHFGFRDSLIECKLAVNRAFFSTELGKDVLCGTDGWLYLQRDCDLDTLNDYLGATRFSERQLQYIQGRLEKRRNILASRGISYLFVIAPNKESVYPEHLPAWLKPFAATKTDQFVGYMRSHSTINILDLRPILESAKQSEPLYYKTDSHWNMLGTFAAYQGILSNLSSHLPGLTPLGRDDFDIRLVPGTGGDLARMAGMTKAEDNCRYVLTPKPHLPKLEFSTPGTNQIDWPGICTLPASEDRTITTINRECTGQAVIYGDSFAVALQPFLGLHFAKVILLRDAFNEIPGGPTPPVLVIDEVVERLLSR